ncbi:MAG: heme o synthase [Gammaproteobacteria bacterium]|nr:heme o synthase [Gammaproteobacteria bacterium]
MSQTASSLKFNDYLELCKPKVVALILFTAVIGMFLATPGMVPLDALVFGTVGIGLAASSAAAINQLLDQRFDAKMARTQGRPLPQGHVNSREVLIFAGILGALSMAILVWLVNPLTAVLTFFSLVGYAVIYTVWLKHATPQNIVIGGAAGAAPPLLGWAAVTGEVGPEALILFLIIFAWTPPHFWALAIARKEDYAKVDIPMLPVTHGSGYTRWQILFYTVILVIITLLPWLIQMSGWLYLVTAVITGAIFLGYAIAMMLKPDDTKLPMKTFGYSIIYLMVLFAALLLDHYLI